LNISNQLTDKINRKTLVLIKKIGAMADSSGLRAYLVGGMVRDIMMGLKPGRDIDITVEGDGMMFAKKLADILKGSYKGFEKFKTGKVFLKGGFRIDIASARTEIYREPAALPDVEPAAINQDLYRRDFTINAMAVRIDPEEFGGLLDPFNGKDAMEKHELRVLHDRSFIDDPTRILRFVRFQSRFDHKADNRTLKLFWSALQGNAFGRVSGERLREEIILALSEKDPVKIFESMQKSRILEKLTPGIVFGRLTKKMFERIGAAAKEIKASNIDPVLLRLMAFLSFSTDDAVNASLTRLKFSNDRRDNVLQARKALGNIGKLAAEKLKKSRIYFLLKEYDIAPLFFLKIVSANAAVRRNISRYITVISREKTKISGKDLKKLGIKEGPVYSKIMDRVMAARLDGILRTKVEEMKYIKEHFM
jgi:tRNA nucleotidyltransferase (CCA-adding enzyme)